MANPHNKSRYGETCDQGKLDVTLSDLKRIKDLIVLSGGWAWHFMSPVGHTELKHAHDHKDVDVFVRPEDFTSLRGIMTQELGYAPVKTRFGKRNDFHRFERRQDSFKIVFDVFLGEVPAVVANDWKVVEPSHLLSLYSDIHSSDNCFAVLAASKIVAAGESPINRQELVEIPS